MVEVAASSVFLWRTCKNVKNDRLHSIWVYYQRERVQLPVCVKYKYIPFSGADSELQVYAVHTHFSFPPSLAAWDKITIKQPTLNSNNNYIIERMTI